MKLASWQFNLLLFFFITVLVAAIEFNFLNSALGIGFSPDDWELYLRFKSLGVNPLSKIPQVWQERGLYTSYQIYYMGLLDFLAGYNHQLFQIINLIFKTLATVSLFPLMLVVFKRRFLAALTTLMYAFSFSAIGSLDFPVKGSDYIAIFWMSIFLIIYYLIVKKKLNLTWQYLATGVLIISVSFSPIRMFPLVVIPLLVEVYLLGKNPSKLRLKQFFLRMLILYTPFILFISKIPSVLIGGPPIGIFRRVVFDGDWYILLSPISGLGYTFVSDQYWGKVFGLIKTDNLIEYIGFLSQGPLVVFALLTLILASLQLNNRRRFFFKVLALNFIAEIIVYFIAFNYRYLPIIKKINFDPPALYPVLFGLYILIVASVFFIKWLKKEETNLVLPFWIGLTFLILFTFATWAFAPLGTGFNGTSYYLVVASIGTSIFLSAFLNLLFDKARQIKGRIKRFSLTALIVSLFILIFLTSVKTIDDHFKVLIKNGRGTKLQLAMQQKIRQTVKFEVWGPVLIFFDTSEIADDSTYYIETVLYSLPSWMHLQGSKVVNGCVEVFYNKQKLKELVQIKNGQKVFLYRGLCVEIGGKGVYYQDTFYNEENFYAFYLKDRSFIDIRIQTLKQLGF